MGFSPRAPKPTWQGGSQYGNCIATLPFGRSLSGGSVPLRVLAVGGNNWPHRPYRDV